MAFGGEEGIPAQGRPRSPLERFGVPAPMIQLHRDHSAESQLGMVLDIVDRYGRAGFVGYRRPGNRVCYKISDLLPAGYEAMVEEANPEGGGPGALFRWRRYETRLWVSRIGGPDRQPRSEDPHQRTLGSPNLPSPPEQDPQDHQPAT